jgi:hypothetical protein
MNLIETVFSEKLGQDISIGLKVVDKVQTAAKPDEPVVKTALEMFGGKVVKEWHNENSG